MINKVSEIRAEFDARLQSVLKTEEVEQIRVEFMGKKGSISLLMSELKNATPEEMPEWYLFGRTQAIKDVYSNKYAVNTVIKDVDSIKLTQVPVGSGIYSGLYILTNASEKDLRSCICSQDFIDYLKTLKKYKSGGYYTISSQELEDYINFHFMSHSDLRSNSLF